MRDHFKGLLDANDRSWRTGHAPTISLTLGRNPGWLDLEATHGGDRAGATGCRAAQVAFIARTVRRTPEVMIKMLNQGGRDLGSVARHLKYLDRDGELPIETDDGEPAQGQRGFRGADR